MKNKIIAILSLALIFNTIAFNIPKFNVVYAKSKHKPSPSRPSPSPSRPSPSPSRPSPSPKPSPKPSPSPSKPSPKPSHPSPKPSNPSPKPSNPKPNHGSGSHSGDNSGNKPSTPTKPNHGTGSGSGSSKPSTGGSGKKPPVKINKKPTTNNTPNGNTQHSPKKNESHDKGGKNDKKDDKKDTKKVDKQVADKVKSYNGKITDEKSKSTTVVDKKGNTVVVTTKVYTVKTADGRTVEITEETKKTTKVKKTSEIKDNIKKATVNKGKAANDNGRGYSAQESKGSKLIGNDGVNSPESILKQKHQYAGGKTVDTLDVLKHMVPGVKDKQSAIEWLKKGNVLHMELLNLNGKNGIYYRDNEKASFSKIKVADKETKVPVLDKNGNPKKDSHGNPLYVQSETFKQVQKKVAEKAARGERQTSQTSGTSFTVKVPKKTTIKTQTETKTETKVTVKVKEKKCDPNTDACRCKYPCPPPPVPFCEQPANKNTCKCNPNQEKCKTKTTCNPNTDACKCLKPCPTQQKPFCEQPANRNSCKCNPNQPRCHTQTTPSNPVVTTSTPTPPEGTQPSYTPFLPPSHYTPQEEDEKGTPEINEDDVKDLDDEDEVEVECSIKKKTETTSIQNDIISGVYSYYIKLIPIKPDGFETLSKEQQKEWEETHIEQALPPQKTELANFLEENKEKIVKLQEENDYLKNLSIEDEEKEENIDRRNKYNADILALKRIINELNEESNEVMNFEFDEDNKKGLSKGGVFTVIVMQKKIAVSFNHGFKSVIEREECDDGSSELVDSKPYTHLMSTDLDIIVQNDYTIESSYQILSARCNRDNVTELAKDTESEILSDNNLITVLQSPKVSQAKAEYFNNIDISFFFNPSDKGSCAKLYSCTSKPTTTGQETDKNTYLSSVNNQLGATSNNKGASKFVFFRDNTDHIIRNNIWYLTKQDNDDNILSSKKAEITIINLNKNGTPNGDNFKLLDKNNNVILTGNELKDKNIKILDNEHNYFNWQGKFASDNKYPHKFKLNYMYNVVSNFEGVNTFNINGVNTENQSTLINVTCPVKLDSKNDFTPTYFNMPKEFDETDIKDVLFDKTHIEVGFVKSSRR